MAIRVLINGKDVTNPIVKLTMSLAAILFVGIVVSGVIFFILPLVGVVLTASVGFVALTLATLGIAIPVIIVGGSIFNILIASFTALIERYKENKNH